MHYQERLQHWRKKIISHITHFVSLNSIILYNHSPMLLKLWFMSMENRDVFRYRNVMQSHTDGDIHTCAFLCLSYSIVHFCILFARKISIKIRIKYHFGTCGLQLYQTVVFSKVSIMLPGFYKFSFLLPSLLFHQKY
jgi:hypothetical protein